MAITPSFKRAENKKKQKPDHFSDEDNGLEFHAIADELLSQRMTIKMILIKFIASKTTMMIFSAA